MRLEKYPCRGRKFDTRKLFLFFMIYYPIRNSTTDLDVCGEILFSFLFYLFSGLKIPYRNSYINLPPNRKQSSNFITVNEKHTLT